MRLSFGQWMLLIGALLAAINLLVVADEDIARQRQERASTNDPTRFDLGVARYPADAGLPEGDDHALVTVHDWRFPRTIHRYRLGYAHGVDQVAEIKIRHDALARRFQYHPGAGNSFTWQLLEACRVSPWTCIYRQVLADNRDSLEPLVDRFAVRFAEEGWNQIDAARWMLAFVQAIPYKLPEESAFGILPPSLVATRDWGDCDSKSLLLMAMLERAGIDSVLLVSQAHAHAVVGVAVPVGRDAFEERGRKYAWAETTADVPLGTIHPSLRSPDDWKVVLRR